MKVNLYLLLLLYFFFIQKYISFQVFICLLCLLAAVWAQGGYYGGGYPPAGVPNSIYYNGNLENSGSYSQPSYYSGQSQYSLSGTGSGSYSGNANNIPSYNNHASHGHSGTGRRGTWPEHYGGW